MKHITGKQLAKIVQQHGWYLSRINGSHHVFKREGSRENLVIPVHGSETLRTGILRGLMKTAELTEEDLSA